MTSPTRALLERSVQEARMVGRVDVLLLSPKPVPEFFPHYEMCKRLTRKPERVVPGVTVGLLTDAETALQGIFDDNVNWLDDHRVGPEFERRCAENETLVAALIIIGRRKLAI